MKQMILGVHPIKPPTDSCIWIAPAGQPELAIKANTAFDRNYRTMSGFRCLQFVFGLINAVIFKLFLMHVR